MIPDESLEWIGVVVDSPAGGMPVLVWYEPSTDLVVDIHVTQSGLAEAAELFLHATEQPKVGEPRLPARLRVADPALADALRGRVEGVEIAVGDISEAREMVASLNEYMIRNEPKGDVDPAVYARLFRATAALYRAKPWELLPSDEWIGVDCAALGITGGALCVVGQHGESYGFTLCRTIEDATAWLDAGERRVLGRVPTYPDEFFMFSFNARDELDPTDVAEVAQHGWEVASQDAYPSLTVIERGDGRLPTAAEIAGVSAMVEGLTAMLHDEPGIEAAWAGDPVEWEGEIAGTLVRFAAPLDVPEPAADPEDALLDILDDQGQLDDLRYGRYRSALMTRLAEREEISDEVLAAAEMLVEFAAQYHHVTFTRIGVEELEALLLGTIPAQLAVESSEAGRIVAAARELMRFAGDELGADARPALELLDEGFEKRLVRELEDPKNFDMGKQLVMAGIAAGFDMSTEDGVAEFVQAYAQAQQAAETPRATAKPKAKPATKAKSRPKATTKAASKPKAKAKAAAKPKAKAKAAAKSKPKAAAKSKPGAARPKRPAIKPPSSRRR